MFKELLTESKDAQYTTQLLGGSIGGKTITSLRELKGEPVQGDKTIFDNKEDAIAKAKQLNKGLTPGEKKYYRMKFVVAEVKDGKYTGK